MCQACHWCWLFILQFSSATSGCSSSLATKNMVLLTAAQHKFQKSLLCWNLWIQFDLVTSLCCPLLGAATQMVPSFFLAAAKTFCMTWHWLHLGVTDIGHSSCDFVVCQHQVPKATLCLEPCCAPLFLCFLLQLLTCKKLSLFPFQWQQKNQWSVLPCFWIHCWINLRAHHVCSLGLLVALWPSSSDKHKLTVSKTQL